MSGACPSALWGHGYISDDNGPDCTQHWADDERTCSEIEQAVGGSSGDGSAGQTQVMKMGMSCWFSNANDVQQTARSMHASGVNVCMVDGSVHFISDFVETGTNAQNLGIWDKLNLSNDGFPIDASKY